MLQKSIGQALDKPQTSIEQVSNKYRTSIEQASVRNININKHKVNNNKHALNFKKPKLPKSKNEVIDFFKGKKWPGIEAEKFYNYFNSIDWKIGGEIKIQNWHSAAENWILKGKEIKKAGSQDVDNLKTIKNKNYDEPL